MGAPTAAAFVAATPVVGPSPRCRLAPSARRAVGRAAALPRAAARRRVGRCPTMGIAVIYASTTGNCEEVANLIADGLGGTVVDAVLEISDTSADQLAGYDGLVVGAPTWNTGADVERSGTDWDTFLYEDLKGVGLDGKPVAVFGTGDSVSYGDNFVDAMEELHDCFAKQGAKMVGAVPVDGYQHTESKAERDGMFLGLPLDQDNEDDLTEDRVKAWCDQIKMEAGWK